MKEIRTDFIESIIKIIKDNGLSEVTLEDDDKSLYIRTRSNSLEAGQKKTDIQIRNKNEDLKEKTITESKNKLVPIVSNMIGVFFSRPSPNEEPFVKVGDKIEKGQQICIIETIKLMNKVVSEVSGKVKEICIEDAKPVEYGQTIMYIEQE